MDERTLSYLEGRFSDYFREHTVTEPPEAKKREWGYIPWSQGDTRMIRHKALIDFGDIDDFLSRARPRHMYFSASKYEDPGASTMDAKRWTSSDLVFDIDADHLPNVDLSTDSYAEMLEKGKQATIRLIEMLEDDLGFDDLEVVFSGGRGYHVHIRDEEVQELGSEARREYVNYVTANGVDQDFIIDSGENPFDATSKSEGFRGGAGWSRRAHEYVEEKFTQLASIEDDDELREALLEIDSIGETTIEKRNLVREVREQVDAVKSGFDYYDNEDKAEDTDGDNDEDNDKDHNGVNVVVNALVREAIETKTSPVDEPVTTDVNRLIRFPGTLHGGSSLRVTRIPRDELSEFDPLVDAVPETFKRQEIRILATDDVTAELMGESVSFEEGVEAVVPEYVGMFLMARGEARKMKE